MAAAKIGHFQWDCKIETSRMHDSPQAMHGKQNYRLNRQMKSKHCNKLPAPLAILEDSGYCNSQVAK